MPFNAVAAECRATMLGVLASWADLVVEERRAAPPRRSVAPLCVFLGEHADWLARHRSAGDASRELARLTRSALRAAGHARERRVSVGGCVEPACPGMLAAHVTEERNAATVIRCTEDPAHVWSGAQWTELERRMTATEPGERQARTRWLTPDGAAGLWNVARGSIYRLACEHGWRRVRHRGRTYYAEPDVRRTLDTLPRRT